MDGPGKRKAPTATVRSEYEVESKLKPFYTGGRVSVCRSKKLAACACGEEVTILCLETGKVKQTIPGDSALVSSVCLSENGRDVFIASRSLQCSQWDLETQRCTRRFKGHKAPILHMCIDSQGLYLCTAGADNAVKVWDIQEGYLTHSFKGHQGVVLFSAFHPHPKRYHLYTCGDDTTVKVWDLKSKKCLATLKAHLSTVTSLSLSPCGEFLLSCGQDSMAHIWSVQSLKKVSSIPLNEVTNSAVFLASKDMVLHSRNSEESSAGTKPSCYFVTVGQSGKVRFWNPKKFLCEHEFGVDDTCEKEGGCLDFVVVDNSTILCTTLDCRILTYQLKDEIEAFSDSLDTRRPDAFWKGLITGSEQLVGNNEQITDLCFLGPKHLVIATNSQYIRVYDAETFACLSSCAGHTDIVLALQAFEISPERYLVASGGKDNTLLVWDSTLSVDALCCGKAEGHFSAIECLAFPAKVAGKTVDYVCSGDGDGFIKLWDMSWFSPSRKEKEAHSMTTLSTTAGHEKDVNTVAFSPDNKLICTGSQDKLAKLWSVPSLAPVRTFRGHSRGIWSVCFSPIDQIVCTASGDKTLRLWSIQDGTCLRSFQGHTSSVLKVCYISFGVQVISTGADGLVKVWNVSSAECVNTFDSHEDKIWALSVCDQGENFASGSGDGEVFVWKDHTDQKALEERRAEADLIKKKQKISDAVYRGSYTSAFRLALDLKYPGQLHRIITQAMKSEETEAAEAFWGEVVESLSDEDIKECFRYASDWNTNSKLYLCSQLLQHNIFSRVHPDRLSAISGLADVWNALTAYSQRHSKRIDTLRRSTYMLDYALK
ncbi:WD40 repeat domain-containing protein [Chloropicon primus]|nr:WD40 repeat domain-containing protein [Chloropicon primus]